MKIKILVPVFVFGLILFACSKNSDSTTNPSNGGGGGNASGNVFRTGTDLHISQLAIYTSNGTITDSAKIADFINRNVDDANKSKFFINQPVAYNYLTNVSLEFLYNQQVNYNGKTMEIVDKDDSLMYIADYDSVSIAAPATPCDYLIQKVPAISPKTDCPTCVKYRPTYPIIVSGERYYVPVLTYAVATNGCASFATSTPTVNVISNGLTASLGATDSVLVQYGTLLLSK
jgi:hypothetical protein